MNAESPSQPTRLVSLDAFRGAVMLLMASAGLGVSEIAKHFPESAAWRFAGFHGDHAATDSARVLRVPGFSNKKYEQDFMVTVHSQTDKTYHLRDFKVRAESVDSDYRQPRNNSRTPATSEPRPISQSERDWAHVKSSLANGADPEVLIAELARSRRGDKSDPQYYARLTVTKALADLRALRADSSASPVDDDLRETRQ